MTFNAGLLLGGTEINVDYNRSVGTAFGKSNVIPQTVVVNGGLRFISEEQKATARQKMREIAEQNLPGTSAKLTFWDRYPAMPPTEGNMEVFESLRKVNHDLGLGDVEAIDPKFRGAGDISFVAPYVSGIDGLGATGTGGHTLEEEIDLTSLAPMTKRAALLIARLSEKD